MFVAVTLTSILPSEIFGVCTVHHANLLVVGNTSRETLPHSGSCLKAVLLELGQAERLVTQLMDFVDVFSEVDRSGDSEC